MFRTTRPKPSIARLTSRPRSPASTTLPPGNADALRIAGLRPSLPLKGEQHDLRLRQAAGFLRLATADHRRADLSGAATRATGLRRRLTLTQTRTTAMRGRAKKLRWIDAKQRTNNAHRPMTRRSATPNELHRNQTRKGATIPYISHLMAVSALVVEHGGTEDQAIAALLHDAVEDQGGKDSRERLNEIRQKFGDAVAEIVSDCMTIGGQNLSPSVDH